ncbi:sorting nexin-33-like isoform X2 [Penaeus chinensis]|uniref:sorting nexin-33-like isoform X2 n=1 Tax=Penaeus chinensis TaxID=139456 RepID=UPI001FB624FF|nr:sorting nexin-33-like isoform X2 [Penaeus chinensis]
MAQMPLPQEPSIPGGAWGGEWSPDAFRKQLLDEVRPEDDSWNNPWEHRDAELRDRPGSSSPPQTPLPPSPTSSFASASPPIESAASLSSGRESRGSVKKSFNPFAKSSLDEFLLGPEKIPVSEKDRIYIDAGDNGPRWRANPSEFTCSVSSPKKESKFHGIKSFIAYTIVPSFSKKSVSRRRYKHFDWIHAHLTYKFPFVPIPPLPEKQISGRFEEDFIEYRMTMLQSWVERICRHPVLSQSETFHHFITCPNDEKMWKAGKRRAENDRLVGANIFQAIERPNKPLDILHVDATLDGFSTFLGRLDESVRLAQTTCLDQAKKYQMDFKREHDRVSFSFSKLSKAFETDPYNDGSCLSQALQEMSTAYEEIGTMYEMQPKHDWDPLSNIFFEYRGLIYSFSGVNSLLKDVLAKRRNAEKDVKEGRLDYDQLPQIINHSDTVAYAFEAELAHFQAARMKDFNKAVASFLKGQISFYQKISDRLGTSLQKFMM